jgi:hypothetical protein
MSDMALISKFLHIVRFYDCEDYCLAVCDKMEEAAAAETSVHSYQTTRRCASELLADFVEGVTYAMPLEAPQPGAFKFFKP